MSNLNRLFAPKVKFTEDEWLIHLKDVRHLKDTIRTQEKQLYQTEQNAIKVLRLYGVEAVDRFNELKESKSL